MITREMGEGGRNGGNERKYIGREGTRELALLWLLRYYFHEISNRVLCVLETLRLSGAVVCVWIPAPENRKFLHKCLFPL